MHLGCKFIPQLDGELAVGCPKGTNKSIFECLDGLLCSVDPVVVWLNQLECQLLWGEVSFDCFGGLIVHDIYFRFEPLLTKYSKFFVYASNMRSGSSPSINVIGTAFVL